MYTLNIQVYVYGEMVTDVEGEIGKASLISGRHSWVSFLTNRKYMNPSLSHMRQL